MKECHDGFQITLKWYIKTCVCVCVCARVRACMHVDVREKESQWEKANITKSQENLEKSNEE